MTRRLLTLTLAGLLAACGSASPVQAPLMALSGTAVTFTAAIGAADPLPQTVTVSNTGGGTLGVPAVAVSYGAAGDGWLTVTVSGTAAPYTVAMQPALAGLAAGTYTATVSLGSVAAANAPLTVDVTLEVIAGPGTLSLGATAVEFRTLTAGAAAAPQVVTATSANPGALARPTAAISYGAGSPAGWLTVDVSAGAGPYTLTFRADSTGLPDGLASASVEVASAGAGGSPRTVTVKLWVGRVVEVRRLLTHWAEDGTSVTAADPAVSEVALLQDDGAGGLFRIVAQPGLTAGSWLALPAPGAFWAELTLAGGQRVQVQAPVDANLLDLGLDLGGRAARQAATAETTVTLALDGLIGWSSATDVLRLSSWGAQASAELAPAEDPVSTPFAFDWAATMRTLLAPDDTLWIGHYMRGFPEGGGVTGVFEYLEAQAATSMSQVTLASGAAQELAPPPALGTTPASLGIDWRLQEMEAAAAPFDPASAGFAHRLGLYAIPAPVTSPSPLGAPPATVIEATSMVTQAAGVSEVAEPAVSVGRFLPAPLWREYHEVALAVPVNRLAPGAATPLPATSDEVRAREATAATVLARPLVGAPRLPTLDGAAATGSAPVAAASLTPVLAWSAPVEPAGAAPTSYEVALLELTASGAATRGTPVATFVLPGTSLKVPAGLLAPGRRYLASVTARVRPDDAAGLTPFRVGVPEGTGTIWTAPLDTAP